MKTDHLTPALSPSGEGEPVGSASPLAPAPLNIPLLKEVLAEQRHGWQKYGRGPNDVEHDDSHVPMDWINMIDYQSNEATYATPQEYRQRMD